MSNPINAVMDTERNRKHESPFGMTEPKFADRFISRPVPAFLQEFETPKSAAVGKVAAKGDGEGWPGMPEPVQSRRGLPEVGRRMTAAELAARLEARPTSRGWEARCPAHDDKNASLSIGEGTDGRVLLKCFAGCGFNSIVHAIGLKPRDLFPPRPAPEPSRRAPRLVKAYDYTDPEGRLLFQVLRYEPKNFKQRRPDPERPGAWIWKLDGVERVLYRLPQVLKAVADGVAVFIVEGEKDVEALESLGLCATCNSGGAGNWLPGYTEALTGAKIFVLPDRDVSGRKHAAFVLRELDGKAEAVRVVELPDRDGHGVKDAADWVSAGGTVAELREIVRTAPEWTPPAPVEARAVEPPPDGVDGKPEATKEADEKHAPAAGKKNCAKANEYGLALIGNDERKTINQAHFAARYVRDSGVVHDPAVSRFYVYDSSTGLWRHQTDDATAREIGLCFQRIVAEEECPNLLAKRTASMLHGLRDLARGIAERRDVFGQQRNAIHVANGMLTLGNDGAVELGKFSPDWYSRNRSEIEWRPGADCPRFKRDLLLAAMDDDDASLIQRYAGQCLLGVNLSQTILVLRGTPGGGKSTVANVLEGVIGRHNVTELRIPHLTERFELVRLVGRTLLTGKDVPGDFLNTKPAHVLKSLVGNDTLEGEVKNGNESFSIQGNFNVLISTNSRLRVKLDSDAGAWRRRLLIVDYARPKAAKPIPGFDTMLLHEEGPGILQWAVEGAVILLRELSEAGRVLLTDTQQRRVDDLLSESDSVRSFVRECIEARPGYEVAIHDLTAAYRDHCEARGWESIRDRQFQAELPDAMLEFHRAQKRNDVEGSDGKAVRGFRGVVLSNRLGSAV